MKGDGNIGAIVQMIMLDLHVNGTGIEPIVRRCVCDAMTFHRNRRYFFSDRLHRFNLTVGRRDYRPGDGFGLPADLVEIASRVIWILLAGNESGREPCIRASTSLFEESQSGWGTDKGFPEVWDYRGNTLRLSPSPNSSDDIAEFRYLTNIGIPRVTWESNAVAFYHPATGENITATVDNWVNDWTLQESGAAAIRARAKYSLQNGYLGDREGAQVTLAEWLEMVGQLEDETESKETGITYLEGGLL